MKVLYVNHTALISGAERYLLDLFRALPTDVSPILAAPRGPLAFEAQRLGVPTLALPGVEASLRLHPWHTALGAAAITRAGLSIAQLARRHQVDLIHANTTRAALAAGLATRLVRRPLVAHMHDVLPMTRAATLTRRIIAGSATVIVANSRYTGDRCLARGSTTPVCIVYNPVDLDRFNATLERSEARKQLGLDAYVPLLGVVAQISPWKAQDDAIRALAHVRASYPDVRLLLVGEPKFTSSAARFDAEGYARGLRRLAAELGLSGVVDFLGERDDVPIIMRALDVLLVPSWEEPFGRTVVESMATETPVIATSPGGPEEIIRDGVDGLLVPPRQPERLAKSIELLLDDPGRRAEMGKSGRQRAHDVFGIESQMAALLEAYAAAFSHFSARRERSRL